MFRTVPLLVLLGFSAWSANLPVREASAPAIIGNRMPAFYNGYLYIAEPLHVLNLFAPDGHELFTLPFQGRDNGNIAVESIAIDSDDTLAVAWRDKPNAGIDIRNLSGTLIRSFDTGRFVPTSLSFGPDHSLWALGWQRDAGRPDYPDRQDYPIVRKYSIDGKELGAYLPRSSFAPGLPPGILDQSRRITVTSDRVGVDVVSGKGSRQQEWVELDLTGKVMGRWKLDPSNEHPDVVFTSDDNAYVERYNREIKSQQLFRLNHSTSAWELVSAAAGSLYGSDGEQLVFAHFPDRVMHLSWVPQPK
ncbi:MAG TPA: hypothetical protein VME17_00130 [Bryobacteraceae bacterium]|nr:hypothetical protein [Bryobacteraceae bacterium]